MLSFMKEAWFHYQGAKEILMLFVICYFIITYKMENKYADLNIKNMLL